MKKTDSMNQQDEGLPILTVRDVLSPIFRHKRLVIGVFTCVSLLSILVAWRWAARYYIASMQIVVDQDRSDPAVTTGQNAAVQSNKLVSTDQITSEIALLQGLDMLRSVATTCGLADNHAWSPSDIFLPQDPARRKAAEIEGAAVGVAKGLNVEAEKTSHVIDVKYGSLGDPETPACVLQNLSKLYVQKHLQLRRPVGSTEFFAEQTEKYKRDLDGDEARLTNFGHDEGVAAPDVLRTNMAQEVAMSEASLYQARQTISADEQRIKNVEAQLDKTPARSTTAQSTNAADSLLENLQGALLAAQVKRSQLLAKFEPTYPLVVEVDQEIAETQEAIKRAQDMTYVNQTTDRDPTYEFLRQDMARTKADLASQQATAATLVSSIQSMKVQMVELDGKAVKQNALMRDQKADEANYLLYLGKREQERSSDALDQRSIADVEIAVPPVVPSLPAHSPLSVMLIGFGLAIALSLAAGTIVEYLDPSFRTPEEVAETLDIPVLASIPSQAA
jgi:polysaccharide biosynthesis protein PslE